MGMRGRALSGRAGGRSRRPLQGMDFATSPARSPRRDRAGCGGHGADTGFSRPLSAAGATLAAPDHSGAGPCPAVYGSPVWRPGAARGPRSRPAMNLRPLGRAEDDAAGMRWGSIREVSASTTAFGHASAPGPLRISLPPRRRWPAPSRRRLSLRESNRSASPPPSSSSDRGRSDTRGPTGRWRFGRFRPTDFSQPILANRFQPISPTQETPTWQYSPAPTATTASRPT